MSKTKNESNFDMTNDISQILNEVKKDPSYINYWNAYKQIQKIKNKIYFESQSSTISIAVISSFTIDPLVACLEIDIRNIGLIPNIYLAPFNQFQ
ncbi:MAG: hypothetical protein ACFFD1_07840, partial [Candidatus Thorarchaeota archaeon]